MYLADQRKGKRYNRETLEIRYKGETTHQVLDMTVEEAREFFDAIPMIARKLQTLMDVGLSYIRFRSDPARRFQVVRHNALSWQRSFQNAIPVKPFIF